MKPDFISKFISNFVELPVETSGSEVNPLLKIVLRKGRYQLCTENAIYSYADLYDNFYKAFEHLQLKNHKIEEVLILGFGLGSIPYMLEKNFNQKYYYTGVEIDPEVLLLANKYVVKELKSGIDFICNNAYDFAFFCEQEFDMICMDVFLDDKTPEDFQTKEFLEELKGLLNPEGILLYNTLAFTDLDKECALHFFETTFRKVFEDGKLLDVGGNYMLLNK
jgi:spermidine synthase